MVNRLTHDDSGKRLKKLADEPFETAQPVVDKPRQHIGARKNKLATDVNKAKEGSDNTAFFEVKPRQEGKTHEKLNSEYEVLNALVRSDYQRMKNQPNAVDNHLREKKSLLNRDREYLTRWIESGEKHNNDVLFLNIVWAADVGEWNWLIRMVDYSVITDQSCDIFKSSAESVAAKAVYIASDNARKDETAIPTCFFEIFERVKSGVWQISVDMTAKFYKLAGILAHEKGDLITAKEFYTQADTLYQNVAVKGRLKEVTALLTSPATNSSGTGSANSV